MDLTLTSPNNQTISVLSLSSSPSSKRTPPITKTPFLGSVQNLRPHPRGIRSRRDDKSRLGLLQVQYPNRFVIRASWTSNSVLIVVAAVATISAISVVYLNQYVRKRKKRPKEVASPTYHILPKIGIDVLNQLMRIRPEEHEHTTKKKHATENSVLIYDEKSHAFDVIEMQDQYMERALVSSETYVALADYPIDKRTTEEKHGTDNGALTYEVPEKNHNFDEKELVHQSVESVLVSEKTSSSVPEHPKSTISSSFGNSIPAGENKFEDFPLSTKLHESGAFEPHMFATGLANLSAEVSQKEKQIGTELVTSPIRDIPGEIDKHTVVEPIVVDEASTCPVIDEESNRAELYTFYNSEQLELDSAKNLDSQRLLSSPSTILNGNGLSSLKPDARPKQQKLLLEESFIASDGSFHQRKHSGVGKGFSSYEGRGHLLRKNLGQLPRPSHPNNGHSNDKRQPGKQLSAYNRLLKEGRLNDSVKLLEDMETMGLLDMNKIYHTRFYDTCKRYKTVEEAFRFTRLIPSPTLSTFNMLMSVCANSMDLDGAFQALQLVQRAGFKADCKLYTTLISTCAKCGKIDRMFEVFHEMVNSGVEPNVRTYGALIDGCARAGQVAKAFGAYGIMRSKNVKPDRVVFNALITACGQSGAVDRAFDVLAEMRAETEPIDPDHITIGALIKACSNAGQVDRAKEVYKMMHEFNIKGTPEVYTIAINCCSQTGDWDFARKVYSEMMNKGVVPDEMFLSALIDVAGHAGNIDAAIEVVEEARSRGMQLRIVTYSSLMGAFSKAKIWEKALELYEDMKCMNISLTVSTINALVTALCDGDQLPEATEVLSEIRSLGLCPNTITYSILLAACEKKDDLELGIALFSQAKEDGVASNITMCSCMISMCLRRYQKACKLGEPVLSLGPGWPRIDNKWTSTALTVYRESIVAGVTPTIEVVSQVMGCLKLPLDVSLKDKIIENLGVHADTSRYSNLCSLVEGFGEFDPRAFSLLEEASSLGVVPCISFKETPVVVDARELPIHIAEVYFLTMLKGLKHRLAAGAKLPSVTILLPVEKTQIASPHGERTINVAGRITQAVAALLRRLGLPYQGNESYGKIRISGLALRRWLQPKLVSPFSGKPGGLGSFQSRLGRGITDQQRNIRTGNLSLD